jgi:hypothetical protein
LPQRPQPQWTPPDTGAQCGEALLPDCGVLVGMPANDFSGTDNYH